MNRLLSLIAIVAIGRNEGERLRRCLESVMGRGAPVIYVDSGSIDGSAELFQKYEVFVDTILNTSDEILPVAPTKAWKATVRIQLKPHRDDLQSRDFLNSGYLEQYHRAFSRLCRTGSSRTARASGLNPSECRSD